MCHDPVVADELSQEAFARVPAPHGSTNDFDSFIFR
jgi:hypothetical protein